MKSSETDNRLVDYLYDELSDEDRQAFVAHLKDDEVAADEVAATAALLKLYRQEAEELTPSVAATERILAEARKATRPWYAALFGDWLPSLLLRPAVGIAAVAVIAVGIGVFAFLSDRSGPQGADSARREAPRAAAPAGRSGDSLAEADGPRDGRGLLALRTPAKGAPAAATPAADETTALGFKGKIAGKDKADAFKGRRENGLNDDVVGGAEAAAGKDRKELKKAEEHQSQHADRGAPRFGAKGRGGGGGQLDQLARGNRAPAPARRLAARSERERPTATVSPQAAPPATRSGEGRAADPSAYKQGLTSTGGTGSLARQKVIAQSNAPVQSKAPATSAPALYNQANTSLAKGRIAEACNLFASLVRSHRDYPRRADALLGWARCEMARGAYSRAEAVIQLLIKEHPAWRKSGDAWLAEIQKQRQQAVLRAQQRSRARRQLKAAPRRPAARPAKATSAD